MNSDITQSPARCVQPACSLLIAAHCNNFMCAGTVMGRYGHDLMYDARESKIDPCDPKYFNNGFPFRIWRDSGIGYALGRNRPEYSIDGQARTAEEAVEMAGNDGVVVTANDSSSATAEKGASNAR